MKYWLHPTDAFRQIISFVVFDDNMKAASFLSLEDAYGSFCESRYK